MKNKTQHATKEQSKSLKNILYVWNGIHSNQKSEHPKMIETRFKDKIVMNHIQGKAPPGCSRSLEFSRGHPPENKGDPPSIQTQYCIEYKYINQISINNSKTKFYHKHLNFIIMKKQILFLALFTLALIFAGSNNVFGQVYKNYVEGAPALVPAVVLPCAGTATTPELTPTPGVKYTYTISTAPAAVASVLWFVTDQSNVINGATLTATRDVVGTGSYILAAAPAGVYNVAGAAKSIDITWKNFDGAANNVLLVAYVQGAAGCSDNVQVWRIKPVFNFTLDVLSMFDNGTLPGAGIASECVSPVASATFAAGSPDHLTMNYGKNYVFFSVNAANFVGSWMPALSAASTYGTIGTVEWATPAQAQLNAAGVASGTWNATTVQVPASGGAGAVVGAAGEGIIVRVEVLNVANEGLAANNITLSVNGIMYDPVAANYTNLTLRDVDAPTAPAVVCDNTKTDTADYTILARPTITESNPAVGTFIQKN